MANVIKYSPVLTSINTIRLGSFAVGVNQGGYGLTSVTGFWNGKTPNVSGYTIYKSNGASSPTLYAAANDSELITYSNQLGGSGNTTIGQALTYFKDNPSAGTCLNVDVPNIVTSGLTIYLDMGIVSCYPKTGSAIAELSGAAGGGSIANSAPYDSTNGGRLYFSNGSNAYVNVGSNIPISNPTELTVICFINPNTPVSPPGVVYSYRNSITELIQLTIQNSTTAYFQVRGSSNTLLNVSLPITMGSNCMLAGIFNKTTGVHTLYVNTTSTTGSLNLSGQTLNSDNQNLCATHIPNLYYEGYVYSLQVYERALSNAEILQNYYAGLQRFIPTNGLVLYLDGNNTNKQVMTASTANDISGNNTNGILTNGVALSRDGQRSFLFDGSNDYIDLTSYTNISSITTNLTVSVWFKISSAQSGTNYLIKFGGTSGGWGLAVSTSSLFSVLYTSTGIYTTTGGSISTNVWHNMTMTFNGTNFTTYLDGSQTYTSSVNPGNIINDSSSVVNIGRNGAASNAYFNGNISTVKVYNQTLTAAQISTIYTAGTVRYGL